MKIFYKLFVISFLFAIKLFGKEPHLIVHFDVNKTLIASDQAAGKSVDNVLNELLAQKFKFCWDKNLKEPISYHEYVRTYLLQGDDHDLDLNKKRAELLRLFVQKISENDHPLKECVLRHYHLVLNRLANNQGNVFSSFYKLIEALDKENFSYTIILRSFGSEVFEVADEINSFVQKNFFNYKGDFKEGLLHINHRKIRSSKEIYETLNLLRHAAIRDDWNYWIKGELKSSFAKPFILDQEDESALSIFFDDNINPTNNSKNIIAPIDAKTGLPIDINQLNRQRQVISVDTLEAILNDSYYLNEVKKSLESYRNQKTKN